MELIFLGTSAGVPTRQRNVTGLALQHGRERGWYLIDCGEASQHRLLRTRLSLARLQAVFITHVHADHCLGLPGLLASASMEGRKTPLTIAAPLAIHQFVETALQATDSELGFELQWLDSEQPGFHWQDKALAVTTVALSHRVSCRAFVFQERGIERSLLVERLKADGVPAGPLWGRLQKGEDVALEDGRLLFADDYSPVLRSPRRLVVAGDNDCPELLADACRDAHLLIHEATYTRDVAARVGPAPGHSCAGAVAAFAESVGLANLILTHFSSRYQLHPGAGRSIGEIALEAAGEYRGGLWLAQDLDRYQLDKDFRLHCERRLASGHFRAREA